jgi:hypothetical protein
MPHRSDFRHFPRRAHFRACEAANMSELPRRERHFQENSTRASTGARNRMCCHIAGPARGLRRSLTRMHTHTRAHTRADTRARVRTYGFFRLGSRRGGSDENAPVTEHPKTKHANESSRPCRMPDGQRATWVPHGLRRAQAGPRAWPPSRRAAQRAGAVVARSAGRGQQRPRRRWPADQQPARQWPLALWRLLLCGCRLRNIRDMQSSRRLENNRRNLAAVAQIKTADTDRAQRISLA